MVLGVKTINGTIDSGLKMSISYILIAYFLLTVGELFYHQLDYQCSINWHQQNMHLLAVGFWWYDHIIS